MPYLYTVECTNGDPRLDDCETLSVQQFESFAEARLLAKANADDETWVTVYDPNGEAVYEIAPEVEED